MKIEETKVIIPKNDADLFCDLTLEPSVEHFRELTQDDVSGLWVEQYLDLGNLDGIVCWLKFGRIYEGKEALARLAEESGCDHIIVLHGDRTIERIAF